MAAQLEFFLEEKSEVDLLKEDFKEIKKSSDKVRKGIFARHSALARQYMELHERLNILEKNICTGVIPTGSQL